MGTDVRDGFTPPRMARELVPKICEIPADALPFLLMGPLAVEERIPPVLWSWWMNGCPVRDIRLESADLDDVDGDHRAI